MARKYQPVEKPHVAALYLRVSSLKQSEEDKVSLETQEEYARKWCADHGWQVSENHVAREIHTGEDYWQREKLQGLLEAAERGEYGILISYATDRLSRDTTGTHMAIIIERMRRAGVKFDFVSEKFEATPLGMIALQIAAFAAGMENTKRVERQNRARKEYANRGRYITGKPPFGYEWSPERRGDGRLAKERLVENPAEWPIMERIWCEADSKTLRAICKGLMADGILTPFGKRNWEQATITILLKNPIYWGKPAALKKKYLPVEPEMRQFYKLKSRYVWRDEAERIPLPATLAPAMVSEEYAQHIHARLAQNKQHAPRHNKNPQDTLLRGGFAQCANCGRTLVVRRAENRCRYVCSASAKQIAGYRTCPPRVIEGHVLDEAVWNRIKTFLSDPERVQSELDHMRKQPAPGATSFAAIDRQIADAKEKIRNFSAEIAATSNDIVRTQLREDMERLAETIPGLEKERAQGQRHYAAWQDTQQNLTRVVDWCTRVSKNLDTLSYDEKRVILTALQVKVRLYRTDECPRATLEIRLPVSGAMDLPLFNGVDSDKLSFNRFTGPGRVGIQSMYVHLPTGEDDHGPQTGSGGINIGGFPINFGS